MPKVDGYTQNAWEGTKYQSRDIAEIAKLIRADIKDAVKTGKIPKGKYSVSISRFAGGCSCDVVIRGLSVPFLNPDRVFAEKASPHEVIPEFHMPRLTPEGRRVKDFLKDIMDAYRRDDSDGMIDYFDTNFYGHVEYDWRLEQSEREALLANQGLANYYKTEVDND